MAQNPTSPAQLGPDQLKELSGASGPCISIYFPIHNPAVDYRKPSKQFERSLNAFAASLARKGITEEQAADLLAPVRELIGVIDSGIWSEGGTLVVFRSPDIMQQFFIRDDIEQSFTAAVHFFVRPVLPNLTQNRKFMILALSQNRVRLLQCDSTQSTELSLPHGAPRNFQEYLDARSPQTDAGHEAEMTAPGSGPVGSFTSTTDRDNLDSHLANFYRAVNYGIVNAFKENNTPLVLAGVEYEIPIYRKVNTYKPLVEEPVLGAPDGLKGGELHNRAFEVMEHYWEKPLQHALEQYERNAPARTSTNVKAIVQGAHDGRVLHLLLAETAQQPGTFEEPTHKVRLHPEQKPRDEDLINAAALETISRGGEVHVCSRERIPGGAAMAAVFRW